MAIADYRLCDICHCKTFYDATLNYESEGDFASAGGVLFGTDMSYVELYQLGSWSVLCRKCSLDYKIVIEKIK